MLDDFPCINQPTGWSCLPTCVRATLRYQFREDLSAQQASRLCQELPSGGCYWDKTINALRDGGYEIQELNEEWATEEEAFAALIEAVEGNDVPVVVQIKENDWAYHAIVIVGVSAAETNEIIVCMNPDPEEEGKFDRISKSKFLQMWDRTNFAAFHFET